MQTENIVESNIIKLQPGDFLSRAKQSVVVDVRSPGEYEKGHIPGAVNIPIFTDEERSTVGKTYKQTGKSEAIFSGLNLVGPKLESLAKQLGNAGKDNPLLMYCWRGGMRSASMAWLGATVGVKVTLLEGGYKAYRNYVLSQFENPYKINILSGKTGSAKTEILKQINAKGFNIVDLEGIANHRGSAFGSIGLGSAPTQEQFENSLARVLTNVPEDQYVWFEDESRHIGRCIIPLGLWNNMRSSPVFVLDIPEEVRIDHLLKEYKSAQKEDLLISLEKIRKRLGEERYQKSLKHLKENNLYKVCKEVLDYYDKAYLHGLTKRKDSLVFELSFSKIEPEIIALKLLDLNENRTQLIGPNS